MKKSIWSATCAVLVGIVTVAISAQAPPTQTSPQAPTTQAPPPTQPPSAPPPPTQAPPPAADRSASAENKVTVTGCLTPAPPAPTGTAGSADAKGDPASEVKFLLTNAASASGAGAPSSAPAARTYRLIANETALTPHSGKKLELTGTIEGQESSAGASAAPDGSSKAQSSASAPRLRVESGKIVAPQCSE
jgi:hypothetical protein